MKIYLERFGPVISCRLTINKTGDLKGFGFAMFENPEDAKKACGANHHLNGKRVSFKTPFQI